MPSVRTALVLLLASGVAHAQSAQGTEQALPSPAAAPPPASSSPENGEAPRVEVHFATEEPGVTVYSRPVPRERLSEVNVGEPAEFEAVCKAPCDAALDRAVHEFALAPAGGAPIPAAPAFEIRSDARFRGDIISHQSTRTAGWWILGIMGTVGVTSTTIGMTQTCVDDQTCQEWTSLAIWSGIAVTAAGLLMGLPKIATSDEATLTLVPGTSSLTQPAGARLQGVELASVIPSGATVVFDF
jgi:hypothetical protein